MISMNSRNLRLPRVVGKIAGWLLTKVAIRYMPGYVPRPGTYTTHMLFLSCDIAGSQRRSSFIRADLESHQWPDLGQGIPSAK